METSLSYMNKYETLQTIDEGQYGIVMKARNKENSEIVAIKKFKEDDSDEENKRIILREVKILKTLAHQNIIELKEAFRRKGKIYLVCEYVERNLLKVIEEGLLNTNDVRRYIFQLLKGLQYMHSLNIIHRDIKPENVLISSEDKVKICDLGFARTLPSSGVSMTDYVATRWYRSPELLIGKCDYDRSIDIWSAGCIMAEMIDGEPLFGGENDLDQLYLIQKCLGPLPAQQQQFFLKNPKFIGIKFPQIHSTESIDRKYFGKIDKFGLDLLKKMLRMDPRTRITCEEALRHQFFHRNGSVSEMETKKYHQQITSKRDVDCNLEQNEKSSLLSHSIAQVIQGDKPRLTVNNFLQDKPKEDKRREERAMKMKGISKLKKSNADNQPSALSHKESDEAGFSKGKSLGNKKIPATIREGVDKTYKLQTKLDYRRANADIDDYYEQKWDQDESHKQTQLSKREDVDGKKRKSHKDNIHIVFNHNTYNLNLVELPH